MDAPSPSAKRDAGDYARVSFEDLAREKDADLDVAVGAALIARDVYPELDVASVLDELDRIAAPLFGARLEEHGAEDQARVIADHLYGRLGFRGNESAYYDPKNSLLSDVLTRKLGIPLTLAIVYTEVARRVGVPARGVGFPGHFLVRIERAQRDRAPLIVDPFFCGRPLGDDELRLRLRRAFGPTEGPPLETYLTAANSRAVLVRMLTNLKAIYVTRGERARAHLAADRLATLLPQVAGPLIERGMLAAQLGAHQAARSDLQRALGLRTDEAEEKTIRAELAKLEKVKLSLN
jgi:regulator of sirC expression with transglutaminase-like and TPR domain